jgi:hypothetical protein
MSNVPMAGAGGASHGWYPPPYGHSGYQQPPSQQHHQQQHQPAYPPSGQQPSQQQAHHSGMYGGNMTHQPPPATHHPGAPQHGHSHNYPPQPQQSYAQYQSTYAGYQNPPSSRGTSTTNSVSGGGAYQPHQSFGDPQYANYQYHHQPPYSYQHQPYGYPPPPIGHHMSEDSADKGMVGDHRPPSELEYHHGHESNLPPHSTPRPDSRMMGQYGYYGPPSGGPPGGTENHPQFNSNNQHTPIYPNASSEQVTYNAGPSSASSLWMNYPVGTPNAPTPQTVPTPSANMQSNNPYHHHANMATSPQSAGNTNSQSYYPSQQPYHSNPIGPSVSFPAPPPFPYQERRPNSGPSSTAGVPSSRFDQSSSTGKAFDPPVPDYGFPDQDHMDKKTTGGAKQSKEKTLDGTRRRFLFGSHVAGKHSNSPDPSPRESDSEKHPIHGSVASNFIPPVGDLRSVETPPKESRHRNSLQAKFDETTIDKTNVVRSECSPTSETKRKRPATGTIGTSKTPSFDDASLLLGLRTHSNTNSPETVPATVSQDSNEDPFGKNIQTQKSEDKSENTKGSSEVSVTKADDVVMEPDVDSLSLPAYLPAPNTNNMVPLNYPKRLALPNDAVKLNSLHCLIRSELLEIFVIEPSSLKNTRHIYAPSSSVGRVGLRCVHCAMARRKFQETNLEKQDASNGPSGMTGDSMYSEPTDGSNIAREDEAPMAVFYPKSIAEIYRLITSWQRCHLRKCKNVPPPVRAEWNERRVTDKTRGKTNYWVTSSKEIGMIDCTSRAGGIRFRIRVPKDDVEAKSESVEDNAGMKSMDADETKMAADTEREQVRDQSFDELNDCKDDVAENEQSVEQEKEVAENKGKSADPIRGIVEPELLVPKQEERCSDDDVTVVQPNTNNKKSIENEIIQAAVAVSGKDDKLLAISSDANDGKGDSENKTMADIDMQENSPANQVNEFEAAV